MSDISYSYAERFLHYLALSVPSIGEASFELESYLSKTDHYPMDSKPVFVAGLARAGTTILMRALHETGRYRSLTYRDMPFVLMPNTWKNLSTPFRRSGESRERAHGDGIHVNYDSPEAFEEVFWRCFCGKDYIMDDALIPLRVNSDIIEKFRRYVALVVQSTEDPKHQEYLSKNNNNILRLPAIREAFPNGVILIPFRDPVQQSLSLERQHKKFSDMGPEKSFTHKYMTWLVHAEFGRTHKPFLFSKSTKMRLGRWSPDDINYWLCLWTDVYEHLLEQHPPDSTFVCYERLCLAPEKVLGSIFSPLGLGAEVDRITIDFSHSLADVPSGIDPDLARHSSAIYEGLLTTCS